MNFKYFLTNSNYYTISKQEICIIFLIFVVAFTIRTYDLDRLAFNNDEAIYAGQAASLANYSEYQEQFSIFRAHPLLLQFMISLSFYFFGINEFTARIVPVFLSCGIVVISYFIAKFLYNQQTAIISSIILSLLPYHVAISKQALVDVSMAFFFVLDLLLLLLYSRQNTILLLYGIGITSGLSFLSKEVGIISFAISLISIILINKKIRFKNILIVTLSFIFITSPYWISFITLEEARESLLEYIDWQSSRPANHDSIYYFLIIFTDILGYILASLLVMAYLYIIFSRRNWKFSNVMLPFLWIAIPLLFYQMLSVKGYHFLFSITPFLVIFGISFLSGDWIKRIPRKEILLISIIPLTLLSNNQNINEYFLSISYNPVLGSESLFHMKDAAMWIKDNTPENSTILTLYTHMSNIIKFYSHRDSIAIQSNNNPSYQKLENIDISILAKKINYIVYEKIQIDNGKFLQNKAIELEDYVKKYDGVPVYVNYQNYSSVENNKLFSTPAIIVYEFN
ncbi:MAG: glycosyltransferase family 39 protein [Nitrososphaeraceae archaeon]|nr:glycosyltransferase family 39 protein [Nitrososphaeraceae archaeon]